MKASLLVVIKTISMLFLVLSFIATLLLTYVGVPDEKTYWMLFGIYVCVWGFFNIVIEIICFVIAKRSNLLPKGYDYSMDWWLDLPDEE